MARTRLDEAASLTVADVTHSQFKALPATVTVGEVQEWFQSSTSRQMALLTEDGRYAGRLLRGDLDGIDAAAAASEYAERGETVAPDEPASRGEEVALATPGLRVPVVDGDGRLVGIVAVTEDRQG
ncbi:MAG TPA: CBS domain-containing protein, partial [Solirubrobacteraceae bacterium]|nr:CBS domain-containing protein [Solirubrobacteraceae bacterium]